jgi:hypothetical protein
MSVDPQQPPVLPATEPKATWMQRFSALLFILVCFEVGVFLVVFPWLQYWPTNRLATLFPGFHEIWTSSYFRGALSGLGVVNLYISLAEIVRLRRFGGIARY